MMLKFVIAKLILGDYFLRLWSQGYSLKLFEIRQLYQVWYLQKLSLKKLDLKRPLHYWYSALPTELSNQLLARVAGVQS